MTVALASPPTPPGSLTSPAPPRDVLHYLDELRRWRDDLRSALDALDRRTQVASTADAFTADLTLALSLSESIGRRTDELITTWDSGRVGDKELAQLAQLMWGRLPDALGNPSAFSLSEATTLAAALEARLAARLDADTIAGSGAADRIAPLRETLVRCHDLATTLERRVDEANALADQLDRHQNDDHVLAVEEDAQNAKREHGRGNRKIVAEPDDHDSPCPDFTLTISMALALWRAT